MWFLNGTTYPLSPDPKKAKAQIKNLIPEGTSVVVATNRMSRLGFSCRTASGGFTDEGDDDRKIPWNTNFVECVIQRQALFLVPEYLWVIGLPLDQNNQITNVWVRVSNRTLVFP
jgi:hypothetical protein